MKLQDKAANCVDGDTHYLLREAEKYTGEWSNYGPNFENFATWLTYQGMANSNQGDLCRSMVRRIKIIEEGEPIPLSTESEAFEEFKVEVRKAMDVTIHRLTGLNRVAMEMMFRRDVNWDEVAREFWKEIRENHRWEGRDLRDTTKRPVVLTQGRVSIEAKAEPYNFTHGNPKQLPPLQGVLNGKPCAFYLTWGKGKTKEYITFHFRVADGDDDGYKFRVEGNKDTYTDGVSVSLSK